jgi:hypothetical protein
VHSYPEVNNKESRFFFLFPFCCQKGFAANPREMTQAAVLMAEAVLTVDLLKLPLLPQALKDRKTQNDDTRTEKNDQRIWQRAKQNLSEDLHPHIARILGRSTEGAGVDHEQGSFRALQFHELTPEARNVLTGRWGQRGLGFKVALSASARRRLGVPDGKPLTVRALINDAYLQFFRSGIGILILECSYRCDAEDLPLAEVILEANYVLCHAGKQAINSVVWATKDEDEALKNEPAFSLNKFAGSLITGAVLGEADRLTLVPQQIDWMTTTRVFTYSAVQFRSPFADSDARRQFAYRLCNKYTSDYSVHEERMRSTLVSAFDNVLHGASIEGGCVVVEETEVDFLKTYTSKVGRPLYLALVLVSFHEFRHLMALTQESTLYVNCDEPAEEDVAQLRRLKHDLINFHLFFRFSHASMISHHNVVHKAWREAFSLDRMLEEVTSDVTEAEKVLSENVERLAADAEREKERRWRIWSTAATGGAAYFTISRVLEIWVQKMYLGPTLKLTELKVRANLATISDFATLQVQSGRIEFVCETVAVFVAIALAVFVYRIKPKSGSSGH